MALPLEVFADLELEVDGAPIDISATGDRIVVDLPSLRAGRRLLDAKPLKGAARARAGRRVQDALDLAGLTLEVRLRGDRIAVLGDGAQPGRLGALLGLGEVELRPAASLRGALRRRPVLTALVAGTLALLLGWLLARLLRS
jgi:hypothetical protein